ncbi:MAG: phosphoribosylformylglycinamidine synthase, partial [Lentisphaeria bacterium]|nr:phosphoribosylformylglycinamidine synthase [Lentisphaeria bacterium]
LDNFCWPDPIESEKTPDGQYKLAQLVRANKALYDYCTAYNVPCISGKDSMKNDSTKGGKKISVPPTLLYSVISKIDDVSKSVSIDFKENGDLIYVLGNTKAELGASEYYSMRGFMGNAVPTVDAETAVKLYAQLHAAINQELCHSIISPGIGGLSVALSKASLAGGIGAVIDLAKLPVDAELSAEELLFSESNSRFIVTVPVANKDAFESLFAGMAIGEIGTVSNMHGLEISMNENVIASLDPFSIQASYKETLKNA